MAPTDLARNGAGIAFWTAYLVDTPRHVKPRGQAPSPLDVLPSSLVMSARPPTMASVDLTGRLSVRPLHTDARHFGERC